MGDGLLRAGQHPDPAGEDAAGGAKALVEQRLADENKLVIAGGSAGAIEAEVRGTMSQQAVADPGAFERAQYVHLILSQNG